MKKYIFLLASLFLAGITANADTTKNNNVTTHYIEGYTNSFIFVTNNIEFSVFPDGQFDFNIVNHTPYAHRNYRGSHVNISFNSGYNYNAFLQYDKFGAVVQIENTPIYYDYYGRISRAGNININYNNIGLVARVGGLYVHYNRYNKVARYSGYINAYNRGYVSKPWHRYYSVPTANHCVVYNRPYRQSYNARRVTYKKPYYNNSRTVIANRSYNNTVTHKKYRKVNTSRRYATTNNFNSRRITKNDINTTRNNNNSRRIIRKPVTTNRSVNRTFRATPNNNKVLRSTSPKTIKYKSSTINRRTTSNNRIALNTSRRR